MDSSSLCIPGPAPPPRSPPADSASGRRRLTLSDHFQQHEVSTRPRGSSAAILLSRWLPSPGCARPSPHRRDHILPAGVLPACPPPSLLSTASRQDCCKSLHGPSVLHRRLPKSILPAPSRRISTAQARLQHARRKPPKQPCPQVSARSPLAPPPWCQSLLTDGGSRDKLLQAMFLSSKCKHVPVKESLSPSRV